MGRPASGVPRRPPAAASALAVGGDWTATGSAAGIPTRSSPRWLAATAAARPRILNRLVGVGLGVEPLGTKVDPPPVGPHQSSSPLPARSLYRSWVVPQTPRHDSSPERPCRFTTCNHIQLHATETASSRFSSMRITDGSHRAALLSTRHFSHEQCTTGALLAPTGRKKQQQVVAEL